MMDDISIASSFGSQELPAVLDLRYEILRKPHGLPRSDASFPGDEKPTTLHLLARQSQEFIGCVTIMLDDSKAEVQLRGMAVTHRLQGRGIGRLLLEAAHQEAIRRNQSLWCNARFSAIGFYEKNGWTRFGEFFDIPVIGKHIVMKKHFVTSPSR